MTAPVRGRNIFLPVRGEKFRSGKVFFFLNYQSSDRQMSRLGKCRLGKSRDRQMSRPANVATGTRPANVATGKCRDRQMSATGKCQRPANVATGFEFQSANVAIGKCRDRQMSRPHIYRDRASVAIGKSPDRQKSDRRGVSINQKSFFVIDLSSLSKKRCHSQ